MRFFKKIDPTFKEKEVTYIFRQKGIISFLERVHILCQKGIIFSFLVKCPLNMWYMYYAKYMYQVAESVRADPLILMP